MDKEIILGIIIAVVAMTTLTTLVIWCVRTINHIAKNGEKTTRETLKELGGGR